MLSATHWELDIRKILGEVSDTAQNPLLWFGVHSSTFQATQRIPFKTLFLPYDSFIVWSNQVSFLRVFA